jgi:hypothetical protein
LAWRLVGDMQDATQRHWTQIFIYVL